MDNRYRTYEKIKPSTLDEYIKYFKNCNMHTSDFEGMHDINHFLRVLFLSLLLCDRLSIDSRERKIVAISSLYHDIGRQNDDTDITHGIASWKKAKNFFCNIFNFPEQQAIKYIIENHCVPDQDAYKNIIFYKTYDIELMRLLINIVKDADSLDIVRFGFFDEKYLRISHSKQLIPIAVTLYKLGDEIKELIPLQKCLMSNGFL